MRDFDNGNWGWGVFNMAMGISDVFLVKSLYTFSGKFLIKNGMKWAGSHTWSATKSYWKKNGIESLVGGSKHHWAISQKLMERYPKLLKIGNQLWNTWVV